MVMKLESSVALTAGSRGIGPYAQRRPRVQDGDRPVEVQDVRIPPRSYAQEQRAFRNLAEMIIAEQLPVAAEAAMSAPIPKDDNGNITNGSDLARTSCAAWYRAHDVVGPGLESLKRCAESTGDGNVETFLQKVQAVVGSGYLVAPPRGEEWKQIQKKSR